jgi:ubiquinone biosynthesis UbiH/UbiF/VisC/COQ6 family hydroxylase
LDPAATAAPAPATGAARAGFDADVIIVGAGPAGLALAVALAATGRCCRVLEQQPLAAIAAPRPDGREIALTHRARRILEALGLWQRLPAHEVSPLRQARVSSGGSPFVLPFDAHAQGHEALGWLVPNWRLREAAHAAASAEPRVRIDGGAGVCSLARDAHGVTVGVAGAATLRAPLVVAADSRHSTLRRMAGIGAQMLDFGRVAIVAPLAHTADHGGVAHECFHYGHTLATLPMAGRQSSAVLTVKADDAPAWLALDDAGFAARLGTLLRGRLGALQPAGARHHYPLVAVYAQRFAGPRFALVGDAAVGMHPVTAHGYNFGLYGVQTLARRLAGVHGDAGLDAALAAYASEHRRATWPIYTATNAIVQLYTDDRPPARLLRAAVLRAAAALPPVRALITRQLTGAAGAAAVAGPPDQTSSHSLRT